MMLIESISNTEISLFRIKKGKKVPPAQMAPSDTDIQPNIIGETKLD